MKTTTTMISLISRSRLPHSRVTGIAIADFNGEGFLDIFI